MRTVLAIALLALAVSAGCTGPGGGHTDTTLVDDATGTTSAETDAETTSRETTAGRSADTTTEALGKTTAETTDADTTAEYETGDELLSVSRLNESQAMQFDSSKRVTFGNLSEERQQVVKQAIECGCNVELDGEFDFHDKDRIEVVRYEGTYYFLRVSIV